VKKLKLDLAQIQVLSFTVEAAKGGGTVNGHGDTFDFDVVYGDTAGTSGTDIHMTCSSCPRYCLDEPIGP
jgi:hypothetical protein